jgi:hypothetical protein
MRFGFQRGEVLISESDAQETVSNCRRVADAPNCEPSVCYLSSSFALVLDCFTKGCDGRVMSDVDPSGHFDPSYASLTG